MTSQISLRNQRNYHSGVAAEQQIEQVYAARGHQVVARRWRGKAGEIDLILSKGNCLSFVEVKRGGDFAQAAERLRPRQVRRIFTAAEEYVAAHADPLSTEIRFDVGLVDQFGAYRIVENAHHLH